MKPETLIIGHEKRWAALTRAFAKGVIPQTLLISGPPHVGKWTLALRYAQLLLCPQPRQENIVTETLPAPCGECRYCHQVEIETFPDFRVFRPIVSSAKDERDWVIAPDALEGSIITVDIARKFGAEALRKPSVGRRKVMLINQADRMNTEAQNALLKTFEEPIPHLSIILLTDNPSQLLPTVYSRCWHLPLGLVTDAQIDDWLGRLHATAGGAARPDWVNEAVRVAGGRPGAAYWELQRLQRAASSATSEPSGALPSKATKPQAGATASTSRFAQAAAVVERVLRSQPVGALGLSEEASRLARLWWDEDQAAAGTKDLKKGDAKAQRSAVARFLDEFANAYRTRWIASVRAPATASRRPHGAAEATAWASGLDQIRKTRHYILRNANTTLALDVMFGHLIALHHVKAEAPRQVEARAGNRR